MTDHELNILLAEVAKLIPEVVEHPRGGNCTVYVDNVHEEVTAKDDWTPLIDHNQMALVRAGLREKGYVFGSYWWGDEYTAFVGQPSRLHPLEYKWRREAKNKTQELRAFALAVAQMKGEQL